jgi:hypothetical protein
VAGVHRHFQAGPASVGKVSALAFHQMSGSTLFHDSKIISLLFLKSGWVFIITFNAEVSVSLLVEDRVQVKLLAENFFYE